MRLARSIFALCLMASPLASHAQGDATVEVDRESQEYKFVACVNEKDQSLLYAMRDAESPDAFEAAAAKAFEICGTEGAESFSMKAFFDAIASFIGKPEYDDAEFND